MAAADSTPILVADDDLGFCGYLAALLEDAGHRTAVAPDAETALELAFELRPHLALLDIDLPRLGGYEVCRRLREEFGHEIAIAFVTGTRTEPYDRSGGLLLGADDYIVKPFEPNELLARVGALLRRVSLPQPEGCFGLTSREEEVLRLLAEGLDQQEIASRLVISSKTVGKHLEHILSKLGAHSRSQAVAIAYRQRLVNGSPGGGSST
jgi:two-component system nitrate/nitrite response regulator NarL